MSQENLRKNERYVKAIGENDVKFTKKIIEDVFIRTVKNYWNHLTVFCSFKCGTFSISDF